MQPCSEVEQYARCMIESNIREEALKRIREREGFRNYIWGWVGVTVLCVVVWALTSPGEYFWPVWPFLGMGVGFLTMYFGTKRANKTTSKEAIDAEVSRIQNGK